jgi:hypothetical protein
VREIKKEWGKFSVLGVQSLFRKSWTAEAGLRRAERKNGGGGTKNKIKKQSERYQNLCQILALENKNVQCVCYFPAIIKISVSLGAVSPSGNETISPSTV